MSAVRSKNAMQNAKFDSAHAYRQLLSDRAIMSIVAHTNEQLYAKGLHSTGVKEYLRFLHHKNLASRFNLDPETTWTEYMGPDASRYGFTLMELERFRQLLQNTRGFPVQGRCGDDEDTWFQSNEVLKKLRIFLQHSVFLSSPPFPLQ